MIRRRIVAFDPEQFMEAALERRCELGAPVRHDVTGDAVPRHPMKEERSHTRVRRYVWDRYRFHPPRVPINDGHEVAHASGFGQGAHEIQVEGSETAVRRLSARQWR